MKQIAILSVCLSWFACGKTWAQPDVAIFADNAFSIEIMNGDDTPDPSDFTDFGTMNLGGPDSTHVFTIASWGSEDIDVTSVSATPGTYFTAEFDSPPPPYGFFLPWTFIVTFQASSAPVGVYNAIITIQSNDPDENPFTFAVRAEVTGAPPPIFPEINVQGNGADVLDGDPLPSTADDTDFGSITLGDAPVVHSFTVQNIGDDLLNVTGLSLAGAGASAYSLGALDPASPVAPFEYATFTVTFDPATAGTFSATLNIANDDPDENPYNFAITGEATTPPPPPSNDLEVRGNDVLILNGDTSPSTSDGTNFGTNPASLMLPVNHAFVVKNIGAATIHLDTITLTGSGAAAYLLPSNPTFPDTLSPGDSTSFWVSFQPSSDGSFNATVNIANDDPNENPYTFDVTGLSAAIPGREISVSGNGVEISNNDTSPTLLDGTDFGEISVGSGASNLFYIYNLGQTTLNVGTISISGANAGDFTASDLFVDPFLPPGEVPSGAGGFFTIDFNPAALGLRQAIVTIANDDPDENPYVFYVQGTGTAALSTWYQDADGDGFGNASVSQMAGSQPMGYVADNTDCDDGNGAVNPAATEVCNGVDDDCDSDIDEGVQSNFYADSDGDGFGDAGNTTLACAAPTGYIADNTDCDDTDNSVHPGAMETCNGVDDNCNTTIDEGVQTTFYADADNDGFGDPTAPQNACTAPVGYVADNTDCDDSNAAVNPSATEVCNGVDDNCDGNIDESGATATWYADADADGFGDPAVSQMACAAPTGYVADNTDCNDADFNVNPAATEVCNGVDDNCDGNIDESGAAATWYADADGDSFGDPLVSQVSCSQPTGYVADDTDCNDNDFNVNPAATEVCNGVDDDCDGLTDESGAAATWYADVDGDSFGDPLVSQVSCSQPMGYVADNTDCDDTDFNINPSAMEVCNGIDDNCDGNIDESGAAATWYADVDGDSFGDPLVSQVSCSQPMGYVADNTDCDDTDFNINPSATEVCNGVDDDCDALVDAADPNLVDNDPPTVSCQNTTVQLNSNGTVDITPAQVSAGATDNCGAPSLSVSPSNFTCSNFGANTVTLTATDVVGNTATCTATVTVQDNLPPTALCKNVTAALDDAGNASITPFQVDNNSTDNCALGPFSLNQTNFDCSNIGANTVTLTVPDVFGNTANCTATVTVVDNLPPTVSCQNITVALDASGNAQILPSQIVTSLADNCLSVSTVLNTFNFNCSNIGANTVIATAIDGSNNTATCSATVTIVDDLPPTVTCQNITVPLDAFGNTVITPAQVNAGASDNCGTPSLSLSSTNFSCANIGDNTVTLTATAGSQSGTCTATVTVVDNLPPTVTCQNITVPLDAFGNAVITPAQVSAGASDNCGTPSLSLSTTNFSCANIGDNTVILTATVGSQIATCTATVTIVDNLPPTAICQNQTVSIGANGTTSIAPAQVNNGSSDNCGLGTLSLNPSNFTCGNIGANTVTLTVPDVNGNTGTCTATVTVQDLMPPTAVCQNLTVSIGANGTVNISPAQVNNGSSDNCGTPLLSLNISSFGCANIGANTVTLSATDGGANTATCTATVTVQDNTPPTALCKNASLNLGSNGHATLAVSDVDNGSFDNCVTPVGLSLSQTDFTCSDLGTNLVTLTVSAGSQTSICTATVTVQDNLPPTVSCQNITVQLNASGTASITASQVSAGVSDNCGSPALGLNISSFSCANIGANTVTLTAIDGSNNTASCTATVTVQDNLPPTAICQNITVPLNASGTATITPSQINNGSSDNCTLGTLSLSQSSFSCANTAAPVSVTLTVPDVNGNTATCTALVTVVDNLPPTAICQNISVSLDSNGMATITPSEVNNGSFDNCGAPNLSLSQTSFDCSNIGANNVMLTATDASGSASTCAATATVSSMLMVNAGSDVSICSGSSTQLNATASGANSLIFSWSPTTGLSDANIANPIATPASTTTYTVTASANGCSATDQVTVTVAPAPTAAITAASAVCQGSNINLSETGGSPGVTWAWSGPNGFSSSLQNPIIPNASPLNAGQYSVTVSNGSGCSATATATVAVNSSPSANAGADVSICAGSTAQLQATGGTGYAWSPAASLNNAAIANPIASPTATTTYTVTVTDGNNCTATDAVVVTVTPQPSISGVLADCDANLTTYTIELTSNASQLTTSAGIVANNGGGAWTVSDIQVGTNVTLTATAVGGCTATQQVTSPNCNCPAVAAPSPSGNTDVELCEGLANPTFSVTVGSGETADWYDSPNGGNLLASGNLDFLPTQNTPGVYNFYSETRLGSNGCTSLVRTHFTLTILQNPTAAAGSDVNICAGASVQLNGSGSNSPNGALGYAWSPAASLNNPTLVNPTATPSASTTYTLTVTDPKGCADGASVNVNLSTVSPPVAGADQTICAGATIPTLAVSLNAGETADWYSAATGGVLLAQGTTSFTPSAAGIFYAETRLLAGGCTSANRTPISLTINSLPTANAVAGSPVCAGGSVQLDATGSSGSATLNFVWSNGAVIANPVVSPATTTNYTVTVTDGNGCSATAQTTAIVNANPTLTLGSLACDVNLINYSFSVTLGGGDQLTSTAGTVTGAGTSYTVTAPSGQNLQLTATNSFTGCASQQAVTGLVCGCPTVLAPVSSGDKTICEGAPMPALSVTVGANETADWFTQAAGGVAVATGTTSFTPSQTAPGIYNYFVETHYTLNSGCLSPTRTPIQLTINALPTANAGSDDAICASETITLSGSGTGAGSLGYAWSPAALLSNAASSTPDFTAASVGMQSFTLTVTDGNGCSATDNVTVDVADKPSLAINSPACNGLTYSVSFTTNADHVTASVGTVTGGAGSFIITDIPSLTNVSITVTNSTTGCSQQQTVAGISCSCAGLVAAPVSGGNQAVCAGATIPALTVMVGPGETANWYSSPTGGTLLAINTTSYTPPVAGIYYAEAVNTALGCVSDLRTPVVLTVNPLPTATITPSGATTFCEGGSVDLTASGGAGFSWSSGETTATISVSATNIYTVTVTGAGGCTATASSSITVNPTPAAAISGDTDLCLGENSVLTASGGTGYSWSTGVSSQTITVSPAADAAYMVTVTGSGGCTATASVNVVVHALPVADAGVDLAFCTNTNGAQLDASGSSGAGVLSFEWSPSAGLSATDIPNPVASPATDATYILLVTDGNGCTNTDEVSVSLHDAPTSVMSTNSPICMNEDLELDETGGEAVAWLWTAPGGSTFASQNPVLPHADVVEGTYSLEITDAFGCSSTDDFDVSLSGGTAFAAKFLTANVACEGDTVHFIEISQTTTLPDGFSWDFGDGTGSTERDPAHVYTNAGTYLVSVVVTEAGCDNFSIAKEISINDCRLSGGDDGILSYNLYPTVTSGRLRLELELQERGLLHLDVFDVFGKLVESRTKRDVLHLNEAFTIDAPGIYFMHIRTLEGQLTLKFVVARA